MHLLLRLKQMYFIDEVCVNFIMHLMKSRSPKEILQRELICFQPCNSKLEWEQYITIQVRPILSSAALPCCHRTHLKSYWNFSSVSYFSQLLPCVFTLNTHLPPLKHKDWGQTAEGKKTKKERKAGFEDLHPRGPSALNVKEQSAGETDSRRRCEWDDWRPALIDSSSSLALPRGWLTMWFISHFVTELIQ